MRRSAFVLPLSCGLALLAGGSALAAWTAGGAGSATARSTTILAPASVTVSSVTSSGATVSVTNGANGFTPTSYTVSRSVNGTATTACTITSPSTSCTDSGAAAGSTVRYSAVASIGTWTSPATQAASDTSIPAATFRLTSYSVGTGQANAGRLTFNGTGGSVGSSVTVTVCRVNSFPCSTANTATTAETGTFNTSNNKADPWKTQQSSAVTAGTYYARAVQTGVSATSPVFEITV